MLCLELAQKTSDLENSQYSVVDNLTGDLRLGLYDNERKEQPL